MSTSPILIIGATGTNGKALVDHLSSQQIPVRALVRNPQKARGLFSGSVEIVQGDLGDPASLEPVFRGIEKVFAVTAVQPNTADLFANGYSAAKMAGVSHFVKFSGLGSSLASPSEVIRQHGQTDDLLRESGVLYTIIRPNSFFQNVLWQAEPIATSDTFYLPLGDKAQSLIDVADIAEIAGTILTSEGHLGNAYDLTGPESLTFHDVARIIGDVRGRPVTYVPVTQEAAEAAMIDGGMDAWSARALAEIQALFATGAYDDVLPDAEQLLGREPRTFKAFVRDHVEAFASKAEAET